jgi:hypothetical protein
VRPPYRTGWLLALLLLSGCAGFSSARDMTPEEIAAKSDEWVCDRLRTFAYKGRLPDAWADASALRGLDSCVIEGVKKRHQDDKADKKRPMSCTLSGSVLPPECW